MPFFVVVLVSGLLACLVAVAAVVPNKRIVFGNQAAEKPVTFRVQTACMLGGCGGDRAAAHTRAQCNLVFGLGRHYSTRLGRLLHSLPACPKSSSLGKHFCTSPNQPRLVVLVYGARSFFFPSFWKQNGKSIPFSGCFFRLGWLLPA